MRNRFPLILGILIGFAVAAGGVLASDSDLQNYAGTSTWNSDLTAASTLLPTDGKKVTADSNTTGKAPVNRSLKQLKDLLIGTHDGVFGSRAGSQLKTVRSLYADATGGASHSKTGGHIVASVQLEAETGQCKTRTGFLSDSAGSGTTLLNHQRLRWTGTAASVTNPASTVGLTNELRALNTPKVWATVSFNGMGTAVVEDGANVFLAITTGGKLRVTFSSAFDNALFTLTVSCMISTTPHAAGVLLGDKTTTSADITIAGADPASDAGSCDLIVMGRQTTA